MNVTWVRFSCWVSGRVAATSRESQVMEEKRHISSTDFSRSSRFLILKKNVYFLPFDVLISPYILDF